MLPTSDELWGFRAHLPHKSGPASNTQTKNAVFSN